MMGGFLKGMKNLVLANRFWSLFNTGGLGFVAILFVLAFFKAPFGDDSGFYLPFAERIAAGYVPYRDIVLHYTPLALYLFSIIPLLLGDAANYLHYLAFLLAVNLINAFILLKILECYAVSRQARITAIMVYLMTLFAYEGEQIILEPFVVIFNLLALLIMLKKSGGSGAAFCSGLMLGLAFLTKQYGLAGVPGIGLLIILSNKHFTKSILQLICCAVGTVVCVALALFYFIFLQQASLETIMHSFSGGGYPAQAGNIRILINYFLMLAPVLLGLVLVGTQIKNWNIAELLPPACMFVCFLAPLFVRQYPHYFLLSIPFAVICSALLFKRVERCSLSSTVVRLARLCFLFTALLFIQLAAIRFVYLVISNQRAVFSNLASGVAEVIPHGGKTLVLATPAFTTLNKLDSVNLKEYGFSFPESYSSEGIFRMLSFADYVLIDWQDRYHLASMIRQQQIVPDVFVEKMKLEGFELVKVITGRVEIWKRKSS